MNTFWAAALLAAVFACATPAQATRARIAVSTNEQGLHGAKNALGQTIVPFEYHHVEPLADGFIRVGKIVEGAPEPYRVGILDSRGRVVLPLDYVGIDYHSDHKRFGVAKRVQGKRRLGYLDGTGREVVPVIYERLDRISNMGDEPTNVTQLNGKFGYIDIVTGETLLPPKYEALNIYSLSTDARGRGTAGAKLDGKWGVISTEGTVLVPFEFDDMGDVHEGHTDYAVRHGKLVQLTLKNGKYTVSEEVPVVHASHATPGASYFSRDSGTRLYVAEHYANMAQAWRGWKSNSLRRLAIPSIELTGDKVRAPLDIFAHTRLPALPEEMKVELQGHGFTLHLPRDPRDRLGSPPQKPLVFMAVGDALVCDECARLHLPDRWIPAPEHLVPYAGIGVAIEQPKGRDRRLRLLDVLATGPAGKVGLKPGDVIIRIDGQDAERLGFDAAVKLLRGPSGTKVTLQVQSGLDMRKLVVVRELISSR